MIERKCCDCVCCRPYKENQWWCSLSKIIVESDFSCDFFESIDL